MFYYLQKDLTNNFLQIMSGGEPVKLIEVISIVNDNAY